MNMKIVIEGRSMDVQVGSLDAKPVVVMVDGDRFEIWPEVVAPAPVAPAAAVVERMTIAPTNVSKVPVPVWKPRKTDVLPGTENAIIAPIPGVIVSVDVKVGDRVEYGQVVCLLEAMKMRNPLRASKAGVVTDVKIVAGQHVAYHEQLIVVSPTA